MRESLSVIIPAYNEEKGIDLTLSKLKALNKDYDIIVVDDGSTDNTYQIAKESGVRVIRHPHNKGYGAALKTGVRKASGKVVLFVDADTQHNINEIPSITQYISEYDMVIGARTKDSEVSFLRRLAKRVLCTVANYLAETKIPDLNSGFRAVKKNILMEFMHILPNTFSFTTTLTLAMIKNGYNLKYVPVRTSRTISKSKIEPFKDSFRFGLLILRTINLFSPLRVFLPVTVVFFILGGLSLLYDIIIRKNIADLSILLLIAAILIFFFGLLADQVAQIRRQLK